MTVPAVRGRKSRTAVARRTGVLCRAGARVQAAFQPIENLQTGEIVGFEALARVVLGDRVLSPAAFLPDLSQDELTVLFREMLGQAVAFRGTLPRAGAGLYVTVNVEAPLVLSDGFLDLLRGILDSSSYAADGSLVLELLERYETVDFARMSERLSQVRALGVLVALDDIGSAYSSLTTLRDLPVDIMKLDQSFASGLGERPSDLHFVFSLQGLARSIGKRLVVEGVETPAIRDALRVLGVDLAQGYAIARPMPGESVPAWLAGRQAQERAQGPRTLLGAYAGHLRVVDACRTLMSQPLPLSWKDAAKDPHACSIGVFFDRHGLHDTALGLAHKRFHEVMDLCDVDPARWQAGASNFRQALEQALADPPARFRCEAVAA